MMMPPKRKKILKVDNFEKYSVLHIKDIDINSLEEFTLPPIDSGMEAEEEKELHLKKVIEEKKGNIPIPIITEVEYTDNIKLNITPKYFKYAKDIKTSYILSDIDYKLMDKYKISKEDYARILEIIKSEVDDNRRISTSEGIREGIIIYDKKEGKVNVEKYNDESDKSIKDTMESNTQKDIDNDLIQNIKREIQLKLLIREDNPEYPSYACFRKRILKPNRKNRRSETQTSEKIVKLFTELDYINEMIQLTKEYNNLNGEIERVDLEISNVINDLLRSSKINRKKIKNVFREKKKEKTQNSQLQGDIFENILFNRDMIRILRKRLRNKKSVKEDTEKEWIAYKNYLKDHKNI